ncbi:MAG: electron transfer flavoprotein subunit alpha/FixB family protein [Candidatus Bathyarchaeia archaeon]
MSILVYSEDEELTLQALGKGRELANAYDSDLYALSLSDNPGRLLDYGGDRVYHVCDPELDFDSEKITEAVMEAYRKDSPWLIIIGATKRGKEIAAMVAAELEAACITDCIEIELHEEGYLVAERMAYGGSTIATEIVTRTPIVATIAPRAFSKLEPEESEGEVIDLELALPDSQISILDRMEKPKTGADLENAEIIVSAGRGFKERDDLKLLEELAELIGAEIGCSRPIAADLRWLEEWVGISGKKVQPSLYLACGISGTVQHAAGIRDSQIIVSINNDESASIHELSDYSIVGDIYEVIPALVKVLKKAF